MEQNKEMTAQESLKLISETLNKNRQEIVRHGGKYFIMWGILLAVFSVLVYFLWKTTGRAVWNNLWFGLPIIGFALSHFLKSKEEVVSAENEITRMNSGIWGTFGIFACSVALFSVLYGIFGNSPLGAIVAGAGLTANIVLLFGMAETISGIALKNWVIKVAGFVTGIGGMAIYFLTGVNEEQLLIFTFAGLVLAATGCIVRYQYK